MVIFKFEKEMSMRRQTATSAIKRAARLVIPIGSDEWLRGSDRIGGVGRRTK